MTLTQMPALFRVRQMLPVQVHAAAGMQVSATGGLRLAPATGLLLIGTWPAGQALQETRLDGSVPADGAPTKLATVELLTQTAYFSDQDMVDRAPFPVASLQMPSL